jgi:hypothetical protein
VFGHCLDLALGFHIGVFKVPEPYAQPFLWSNPEKVLARDLGERFRREVPLAVGAVVLFSFLAWTGLNPATGAISNFKIAET